MLPSKHLNKENACFESFEDWLVYLFKRRNCGLTFSPFTHWNTSHNQIGWIQEILIITFAINQLLRDGMYVCMKNRYVEHAFYFYLYNFEFSHSMFECKNGNVP